MATFVRRLTFARFAFTYGRFPPHDARDTVTVSAPHAIDFSFTGHPTAVVGRDGRTDTRTVPPLSGGATGPGGLAWLRVPEASELVEVRPAEDLRRSVAEDYGRPDLIGLEEAHARTDPFLFALAARLRAHALGGRVLSDLEGDELVRLAVGRTLERFGAKPPRRTDAGLDERRLARVLDCLEARMDRHLTTDDLARVAAVSPHHFARMFKRTTGLSPHAYLTARRMQRAREGLAAGRPVAAVAREVGYAPAARVPPRVRRVVRRGTGRGRLKAGVSRRGRFL